MVGYRLGNTVTEHGQVSRGVCEEDAGRLPRARHGAHKHRKGRGGNARFTEDGGRTWRSLPGGAIVSMNLWGFHAQLPHGGGSALPAFLRRAEAENPLKGEYFLPSVVTQLLEEGKARVKVLRSADKWYGVTYREDKPAVVQAIAAMTAAGLYPEELWA